MSEASKDRPQRADSGADRAGEGSARALSGETLRQYLSFYQDLGIKTLYRRPRPQLQDPVADAGESATGGKPSGRGPVSECAAPPPAEPAIPLPEMPESTPPRPTRPEPSAVPSGDALPSLAPEDDTLERIQADIGDCHRCPLHEKRNKIVFGVGDENTKLVFVGEGPGADEDAQGIPFVGRAGQLLTQMIEGTAKREGIPLLRRDVYICNVVKCRPPENRTPDKDETEICGQFLHRQLMTIRPKAIIALGGTAAKALLGKREGVTRLRGNWYKWREIPLMVTYHPSYLLRPYNKNAKRESWEDLKKVLHFVYD